MVDERIIIIIIIRIATYVSTLLINIETTIDVDCYSLNAYMLYSIIIEIHTHFLFVHTIRFGIYSKYVLNVSHT